MTTEIRTRFLYPNPFEPAGVVLELKHDAVVTVSLTDASGTAIFVPLSQKRLGKGSHRIVVDPQQQGAQDLYLRITAEIEGQTVYEVKRLK